MNLLRYFVLALLLLPAASAFATPNLTSSPRGPYGPYYVGQMPIFYYNLNNTGTTDTGTARPLMNSNWVAVDMFSDNNYPNGKGPHGGWQWVSGDAFGPVPAGGSIIVNNGGAPSSIRWPDNDYCMGATGNHRVMMYVDNGNNVVETNNSDNNSVWSSFTVVNRPTPAPDLTTAPSLTPLGPYIQGQTAQIPFRFFNTGTLVATATLKARAQIDLFNDGSANDAVTLGGAGRPTLALGENRTENFSWAALTAGTHSIRVTYVDNRWEVDEINECNNTTAWVTFQVLPVNLEGRLSPRTVAAGTSVATTSFSIRNIGSIAAPSVPYRITINGVQVASSTYNTPVPVSATWSTITVPISWTAPMPTSTQNLPYVLQIIDPTQGLEATTSVMTVTAAPPPTPRLISCPTSVSVGVGNTTNLIARYWSNLVTVPTCATGGSTDVTNTTTWSSLVPANATVTTSGTRGVVTGVAVGNSSVTATYSGLSAPTAVTITAATATIALAIIPETRFARSGTVSDLRLGITANVNLTCTLTGAEGSPNVFAHLASSTVRNYDVFQTRPLRSNLQLRLRCENPLNPAHFGETTTFIEVIPTVKEV